MSFASSWTTVARDKATLGGTRGRREVWWRAVAGSAGRAVAFGDWATMAWPCACRRID
jgi:hypothetical protein